MVAVAATSPSVTKREVVSSSVMTCQIARLGAILCGFIRTAVYVGGLQATSFRHAWTPADAYGRGLDIYGSEG